MSLETLPTANNDDDNDNNNDNKKAINAILPRLKVFDSVWTNKRIPIETNSITRMHSSRMRTVRCSGRFVGGRGGLPRGVCPRGWCSTVDRILDTCLWKHYLSATTVADGNKNEFQ